MPRTATHNQVQRKKKDLPEDKLDTFQNRNLEPAEWENLADQVLKRGYKRWQTNFEEKTSQLEKKMKNSNLHRGHPMTPAWKTQGLEEAHDKPRAKNYNVLGTQ